MPETSLIPGLHYSLPGQLFECSYISGPNECYLSISGYARAAKMRDAPQAHHFEKSNARFQEFPPHAAILEIETFLYQAPMPAIHA